MPWFMHTGMYSGDLWNLLLVLVIGFIALAVLFLVGFWMLSKSVQDVRVKVGTMEEKINKVEKDLNELLEQLREI
jgi:predicted PurR-regulated permease PerM